MQARSVLDGSQRYRGTVSEAQRMLERPVPLSIKCRMLLELTLTLLKEIEMLKDIQALRNPVLQKHLNLKEEVRRFEIEKIRQALAHTRGHQSGAARMLGVKVTTLHEKLKRYGINTNPSIENGDAALLFEGTGEDE